MSETKKIDELKAKFVELIEKYNATLAVQLYFVDKLGNKHKFESEQLVADVQLAIKKDDKKDDDGGK